MADLYDKTRLVFARLEGENSPMVVGAVSETTWEIIPPEEWDQAKREMGEKWLGPDWTAYDYVEVVVTIPQAQVNALFEATQITPESVELGDG